MILFGCLNKVWYLYVSAIFGSYISQLYPIFAFQDCTLTYLFVVCVQTKHWYCDIHSILNQNKVIHCPMSSTFLQTNHECSFRENSLYSLKSQHSFYFTGFYLTYSHTLGQDEMRLNSR